MKKILLILIAFVYCLPLFSQDALLLYRQNYSKPLLVALKDITNIFYDHNEFQIMTLEERNITSKSWAGVIDSLVFVDLDTLNTAQYAHYVCPDDHHPHMIDLDLYPSTLWSCCNVGASAPEEYGGYYAWGETEEKDYYDWETYIYGNNWEDCEYIGDDIAGTEYDVAHVKWGGEWEMPTRAEFETFELSFEDYIWECRNGVYGMLFVAESGASIFLPAAGTRFREEVYDKDEICYYWTSSYDEDHIHLAKYHKVSDGGWNCRGEGYKRCSGLPVRPVIK